MIRLVAIAVLFSVGCKKDPPAPAAPPLPAPASALASNVVATVTAPAVPVPEQVAPARPTSHDTLTAVLREVFCATRRADRSGLAAIYATRGFKDSADFATAFSAARASDALWAEKVLADTMTVDCTRPQ